MTSIHASDPVLGGATRRAAQVEELIAAARERLGLGSDVPWILTGSRVKLGKTLFEVEENGRRIIGKVSKSDRARHTFDKLSSLWDAGMRPPTLCIVTRPIAWIPEHHLLLQEKASGLQLVELIRSRSTAALDGAERAGDWLHALQKLNVAASPALGDVAFLRRCRQELLPILGNHGKLADRLLSEYESGYRPAQTLVPSHGDYHPMNIFVGPGDLVTAIDLDTFAAREPAYDVSYFLAQSAIFGFHIFESFESTREFRRIFAESAPHVDAGRARLLILYTLIRSLHYDLCILKNGNMAQVEPFLRAAEHGLDG